VPPARLVLAVLAGVTAGLLAGCGGSAPIAGLPGSDGSTGPAPSSAAPSSGGVQDQVLAGYLAYWDAVIHAHRTANAADPELARHAAGAELTKVRGVVARNRVQSISIRGSVSHQPTVTAAAGTSAVVQDCYDVSGWDPVDIRTGKPIAAVEEGGTGRYKGRFSLHRATGTWYVVNSATLGAC
jgi:hypothetical protein